MPNIKSAKKRVLVIQKKTLENKMINSRLKTALKKYNAALYARDFKLAEKLLPETTGMIDAACSDGILHKNNAARKKAQLYVNLTKAKEAAKIEAAEQKKAAKAAEKQAEAAEKTETVQEKPVKKTAAKKKTETAEVKKTTAKKAETTEKKPAAKAAKKTVKAEVSEEKKPTVKKAAAKKAEDAAEKPAKKTAAKKTSASK